jgi:EAL domain-containing protein (putative c-di-GMP-specific phosphodiesterase class I)
VRQCRAWLDEGRDLSISVNVSIRDLHPGFPEFVAEVLAKHGVDAGFLRLEITEGSVMADPARALQVLGELRFLGVGISVDDYGTGYSSLAYLGRLPVDELKIDRAFVSDMRRNVRHQAIVRSTIALGHELGLVVVAEGVEDQATWDLLAAFDCDLIQGYLASKPLPAPELGRWQDNWTGSARGQVGSAA